MQFTDPVDRETAEAYEEGLAQLTDNARHVIMHLTELAHDYARDKKEVVIVAVIERHIRKVKSSQKLPGLYLMDSIVKNHSDPYRDLFQQNIVNTFSTVFVSAPEKVRLLLYKLRNTWNDIFSSTKLYQLDSKVKALDPAWPVLTLNNASASSNNSNSPSSSGNIHINPAVFNRPREENTPIFEELQRKERELRELRKKKIELELEVARKEVEELRSEVERDPKSNSSCSSGSAGGHTTRSSKKTGEGSTRRDPRIRDKNDSNNGGGSHEEVLHSKSDDSSPASRHDSKSSVKSSSKSSFSPSKSSSSKSSLSSDRSRKSSSSSSSKDSRSRQKSSSSSKKSSSSSSKSSSSSNKGCSSPPPKKRSREDSTSPIPPIHSLDKHTESSMHEEQPEEESQLVISTREQESRVKDLGRIPKKAKDDEGRSNKRRGPSINHGEDDGSTPPEKKKKELFEGPSVIPSGGDDPTSPTSTGWAKFKETNPDEFHTPIRGNGLSMNSNSSNNNNMNARRIQDRFNIGNDFRGSRSTRRGGRRGDGRHPFHGPPPLPSLSSSESFTSFEPPAAGLLNNKMIEMVLQNMQNPEHVRNEVIPTIVKQAQENLQSGRMNNSQFSELMRQVMTLKEQAMMIQAERRSNDPFGNSSSNNNSAPSSNNNNMGGNFPPPPFFSSNQPGGPFHGGEQQQQQQPHRSRPHVRDLPQASHEDLELIKNDPVKTIPIDGESRDIRLYDEVCTVVMGDSEIKELSFQPGSRRVIIDDNIIVTCELDVKHYTSVMIDGVEHKIKIGAPTRELWVDGQWFECYFDNKVRIRLGMNFHTFFLEGPAPTVKIGERRPDLCPGKVNLIIDADFSQMMPIFLDAKPQQFDIEGKPHVIRFVEGLKTVLINGHPYRTEFGGMPMVIFVEGIKHFVRLTVLPRGIVPGSVKIRNMPMGLGRSNLQEEKEEEKIEQEEVMEDDEHHQPPPFSEQSSTKMISPPPITSENSNGASLENMDEVGSSSAFDKLLPLFPKSDDKKKEDPSSENYKSREQDSHQEPPPPPFPSSRETQKPQEGEEEDSSSTNVDVHNLWKQLLGAGLVSGEANNGSSAGSKKKGIPGLDTSPLLEEDAHNKENMNPMEESANSSTAPSSGAPSGSKRETPKEPVISPITLKSHHNSLKERQQSVVNLLYDPSALQCKNCGLRYSPLDMISYSQHLDWHFRMKRREKDNAKKAQSRRWYFERMDWIVSDEIEEEDKENTNTEPHETEKEIPTVPARKSTEENTCPVCKEEFEEFYKDDTDEDGKWLLYNAVPGENGGIYHPQCLQDLSVDKSSPLEDEEEMDSNLNESTSSVKEETEDVKTVMKEIKSEPDNDVEMKEEGKLPSEEDIKTEGDDDDKASELKVEVKEEPSVDNEENKEEELPEGEEGPEGGDPSEESSQQAPEPSEEVEEETLDGMEDNSLPVLTAPKTIRVNLTTPLPGSGASSPRLEGSPAPPPPTTEETKEENDSKDDHHINEENKKEVDNELDPDAIVQNIESTEEDERRKPGLKGKKLIEIPTQKKDSELSGLCAIM